MTAPVDTQRLHRLLGGDDLASLRDKLRQRFTDCEDPQADTFTLTRLSARERAALAGLLGRSRSNAASMRLSHGEFDHALQRAGLASDLRAALEALDGPIVNYRAERDQMQRAWERVFANVPPGRLATVLESTAFQGVIKRLSGNQPVQAERLLDDAQTVLAQLPARGISRSRLAAHALGNAHGLDHGRPVATILRRALDPTGEFPRMRDIWATQGVLVSELAKPVAVLNLAADGEGPTDQILQSARHAGEPMHLSLRALLQQTPSWRPNQHIFVCENPDVLTAAAEELGTDCPPMVCLDGQLSASPRTLLDQLQAADGRFAYHGDFDWPGLRIANGLFARYTAIPWRYSADDYQVRSGPALQGNAVNAIWDDVLTSKMKTVGLALHEEAQLPDLLADLKNRCW